MIRAAKEYWHEVYVPAIKWLSRHWKGYMAFVVTVYAITIGGVILWAYSEKIEKRFEEIKAKFMRKEEA